MKSKSIIEEEEKAHENSFIPVGLPTNAYPQKQTLKQARLSAYSKLGNKTSQTTSNKFSKKGLSKEETSILAQKAPKNEMLTNNNFLGQGNIIETRSNITLPIPSPIPPKMHFELKNDNNSTQSKDFIDKCEQYYNDKFTLNQTNKFTDNTQTYNTFPSLMNNKDNNPYEMESTKLMFNLSYSFCMLNNSPNAFCYHKNEKWFAYISHNHIIIEDFSKEFNRKQEILTHSQEPLSCIKLSPNNKIIYAYSTHQILKDTKVISNPFVLFYAYKQEYETKYVLINKCSLNQNEIVSCEISPRNNLSIILSRCKGGGSFISVLDFYNNEILVTTGMNDIFKAIKWNSYLKNLEFSTISDNILTFWRINSTDGALQYQNGTIDYDKYFNENNVITSLEFIPPIENNVLLLIGDSNGNVYGVDTRTNSLLMKWDIFIYNSLCKEIKFIYANLSHIAFVCDNEIKYFHIKFNEIKKISELFSSGKDGILSNSGNSLKTDSEIISIDYNTQSSNDSIVLTKNGLIYYIDFEENCTIKLFHFLCKKNKILQIAIMKKVYDKYTIAYGNNPYENPDPENEALALQNIQENYYLITSHEGGAIKIWSIPEYILLYNYETVNEDILCFNNAMNDLLFAVAYTNTTIRFFTNEKLLGKFSSKHLSSYASFNFIKFLPDSQFIFLIDTTNTLYLIHIEKYEPLLVQFHQVFKVEHNIVDFKLSLVEYYNKFLFNLQNVFICVYNRKFTNIMKNLSYENSIPQFYIQDKFNIIEYFKNNNSGSTFPKKTNERYTCCFSPNASEKNYIYILSKGNRRLIVRNFETHVIENIIQFNDSIDTFSISNNFKYFIFLYSKKIQITSIELLLKQQKETCNTMIIENISENEQPLMIYPQQYQVIPSDNSRIAIVYSNCFIFVYKL